MNEQAEYCLSGDYRDCPNSHYGRESSPPETLVSLFGWDWRSLQIGVADAGGYLFKGLLGLAWMGLAIAAVVLLSPMLVATNPGPTAGEAAAGSRSPSPAIAPLAAGSADEEPAGAPMLAMNAAEAGNPAPTTSAASTTDDQPASTSEVAPIATPSPAQIPTAIPARQNPTSPPAPEEKVYVVQKKDTLYSLARAHGITVEELMEANGLTDKNFIWSGQKLIIPLPRS